MISNIRNIEITPQFFPSQKLNNSEWSKSKPLREESLIEC